MRPGKKKCDDSGWEKVKVDMYFSSIDSSMYEPLKDKEDEDVIWRFFVRTSAWDMILVSIRTYFADLIDAGADALSRTETQNNSKYGRNQANLNCESW